MMAKLSLLSASWRKTRRDLLSALVDFLRYLYIWAGVLLAHLLKLAMGLSGIDPVIVKDVALLEKWTWIASFACFFVGVLIRAARGLMRDQQ